MNELTDYVKTAEATKIHGVAQNTLRKWTKLGKIPMRRNSAFEPKCCAAENE